MSFKKYLHEAMDKDKLIKSLEKRLSKVGNRAQNITLTKIRLSEEVEKIQKKMKIHGIENINGLDIDDDPDEVIYNMMA